MIGRFELCESGVQQAVIGELNGWSARESSGGARICTLREGTDIYYLSGVESIFRREVNSALLRCRECVHGP